MCVILACPDNVRPNEQTLRNCERGRQSTCVLLPEEY